VAAYDNDAVDNVKAVIAAMPKTIRVGQQNKHITGTHEYMQYAGQLRKEGMYGPSTLSGGLEFAQRLVDKYAGTGMPDMRDDRWLNTESITTNELIGIVVNNRNGIEQTTSKFKIHYSKYGTHVVPDYM
jgi:hypothetical protein